MAAEKTMPDDALLKSFTQEVLDKPEVFLSRNETSAEQAKAITKYLYDLGKSTEAGSLKGRGSMLEELFVDGFDNDQIWEEIHMQNAPFLSFLKSEIKNIKTTKSATQSVTDEQEEEEEEDAEMSLGLDDEDMGLDMEDTDNMEGFSGEDEDEDMEDSDSEKYEEYKDDAEEEDDEEVEDEEEEDVDDLDLPVKKKTRTSEVDDEFFNLDAFNAMTEKQEQDEFEEKEPNEDEEEIDYFADPDLIDSGDEDDDFGGMEENENEVDAHDVGYQNFFAPPEKGTTNRPKSQKKPREGDKEGFYSKQRQDKAEDLKIEDAKEDDESEEVNALGARVSNLFGLDEEEVETENLSKFEKSQRKIREQIDALEQESIAAKDWTKKGEASSSDRPVNSLLEEDMEFETVSKPIPVITAESTQTLEDIIKERILAANWDDVVRKAAPNPKAFNPSSRVDISDEKSKKSLAELYEDDYVRQTSTAGPVVSEREAALEKRHDEITGLWQELCQKLDSLSNWHYTPKPAKAELTIVTNAPAISMEEAIPVSVADAALLAPEEIYSAGKTPIKGDTEMEQAERKRKRSHAKRAKKAENKEKARKDADRLAEREARDRRLGRQVGDKGNSKTIVRDKMDAVKTLSGQKNISFIDREGNKRSSIKGHSPAEAAKSAKLKL